MFYNIYQVKIHVMKLGEALLCQSLICSKNREDIVSLIEQQEKTTTFYKSFLELEKNNLLGLLSFDTRSVTRLLSEQRIESIDK